MHGNLNPLLDLPLRLPLHLSHAHKFVAPGRPLPTSQKRVKLFKLSCRKAKRRFLKMVLTRLHGKPGVNGNLFFHLEPRSFIFQFSHPYTKNDARHPRPQVLNHPCLGELYTSFIQRTRVCHSRARAGPLLSSSPG